jgi:membrane peptidoglycan carboxypeptidase
MSDNPNDATNLWKKPDTPGAWRESDEIKKPSGWRVLAIPADLEDTPQQEGAWHRPNNDDTPFKDDQKIEIALKPEDEPTVPIPEDAEALPPEEAEQIQEAKAAAPEDILPPEDMIFSAEASAPEDAPTVEEEPVAPEDLIYMIEHSDEEEDGDFDNVGWSELVALASLAESEAQPGVEKGSDSLISADLALTSDDEDSGDVDIELLSPAERMALGQQSTGDTETIQGEVVDEDDPGAYARQQMQALMADASKADRETDFQADVAEDGDDAPADPNSDPAAYARQQLAALQGDGGSSSDSTSEDTGVGSATAPNDAADYARQQFEALQGSGAQPSAAPVEELSPRDIALLEKYRNTEDQVRMLRQQRQNEQITQDQFLEQLRENMVLDDDQVWWMMGVETDTWYRAENGQWVEDTPDVFAKEQRVNAQQQDSSDFGSLPYLQTDAQQNPGTQPSYGEYSGQQVQNTYDNMPLPQTAPLVDPNATVPSPAYNNQATVPSSSYSQETIPSGVESQQQDDFGPTVQMGAAQPVGYGTIESPYSSSEPPAYDIDETEDEGEIYAEAAARQRRSTTRLASLIVAIVLVLLFVSVGGFIALATFWYDGEAEEWQERIAGLSTTIDTASLQPVTLVDINGNEIAEIAPPDERISRPVPITEVSPFFIHAMLTLNDPNYYAQTEWGFTDNFSQFVNSLVGEVSIEASPITFSVADRLLLSGTNFPTEAERQTAEAIVVNEMIIQLGDAEILEYFYNDLQAFGNQTFGVEAAAQFYFNKAAVELTFPEAAMLAGIAEDPTIYDPIRNRQQAEDRMNEVMALMADTGCITFEDTLPAGGQSELCLTPEDLSSPETANAKARVFRFLRTETRENTSNAPHFVDLVRNQLEASFGNEIYRSGYVVTTTLDLTLQNNVQAQINETVRRYRTSGVNTGSIVVTDPRTGAILAMVGSADYNNAEINGNDNQAYLYEMPGDIIKPIVYAMALDGFDSNGNGLEPGEYITPASILWDVPTAYSNGQPIQNDGNAIYGPVRMRQALGNALNIPAVKTYVEYGGADRYREQAERMGIVFDSQDEFTQVTATGQQTRIRLIDMVETYGTIATNGEFVRVHTITSIQDSANNDIPLPPALISEPVQAIQQDVAYLLKNILGDDSARQPTFAANGPLNLPTAASGAITGTSRNTGDLWTMGFTNNRVVGVWFGSFNDDRILNNLTGFTVAAPVWNEVIRAATAGTEVASTFQPTPNVLNAQVCADTGAAYEAGNPTACSNVINEFFISSRRPPTDQTLTVQAQIDSWSGLIANNFCPDNQITRVFTNIDDITAIEWINNNRAGNQYAQRVGIPLPAEAPPTQACDVGTVIPSAAIIQPQGGQTVQGTLPIVGQVGANEFGRYEIQFAPANTESFQTITTATQPQPNAGATLATWDTTSVPNGQYTIRLAVFANNANNGFVYRTVSVNVNNPLPTATPQPTQPPPPTAQPTAPSIPTQPLPFDALTPTPSPGGPTPTIDPLG